MQVDNATQNHYALPGDVIIEPGATNVVIDDAKLRPNRALRRALGYLVSEGDLTVDTAPAGYALDGSEYKKTSTIAGPAGEGRLEIAAAGTPEPLSETSVPCRAVKVTAIDGNTGLVAIGSATVDATAGSETGTVLDGGESETFEVSDASSLYVDAGTTGDGVTWLALR